MRLLSVKEQLQFAAMLFGIALICQRYISMLIIVHPCILTILIFQIPALSMNIFRFLTLEQVLVEPHLSLP